MNATVLLREVLKFRAMEDTSHENSEIRKFLVVEPMGEADIEAVAAIEGTSFSDPWPIESFRTELIYNQLASYYVARLNRNIIAYIGAWIILDEVHITTLAVEKKYRRQGIASLLLETLFTRVQKLGARCLTLEVRPSNKAARNFYEKYGFKIYGRRKRYYGDEDALIMTKDGLNC